ncbi:integrase [Rhodococcus opacus]|nr:integrase [Rhodococcus opacus]
MNGTVVLEEKWPVLGRHVQAAGRAAGVDRSREGASDDRCLRTGLAEYLEMCEREGVDPLTASRAHVGVYVRELTDRPSRRGANVVSLDSGSGLANATIQQRLVPVRLFYDHLMWKRACASPIPLAGVVSRPADAVAGISAGWCPG